MTPGMTCEEITRLELMERYVLGRLEQPARDEFDEHLFECAVCFERLQTLRAVRIELAATAADDAVRAERELARASRGWIWKWALVPAFAVLVIASVIVWPRVFRSPPVEAPATLKPGGQTAGGQAPSGQAPSGQGSPAVTTTLAELGRFEPPPFNSGSLRGTQDASAARFRDGMTQYVRGNYRAAIAGLRAAARLDPEAAHATFFLGVCHVINGEYDDGVRALRQTIQLGDSPFLEEAHFYLAKAFLQQSDAGSARHELLRTIALKGPLEQQARRLLADVERREEDRP